ncbi:MAG: phosphoenolpyruvate hydrolase family protein [Nitrospinota bacterium]
MARAYTREEVIGRLKAELGKGAALFNAFAGTGISAKFAEAGGADLITTHILARFRMAGLSSMAGYLPIGDANAITLELGKRDILPVVKETPVMAGLLGADPTREMGTFLEEIKAAGFCGVLNCPTLALVDGQFRQVLEETGLTFDKEVEMMRLARERGLFTKAFVTDEEEAQKMLDAGVDNIIIHLGNSKGGTVGSKTVLSLEESCSRIQRLCDFVKKRRKEVFITCHGGSVASPEDVRHVLGKTQGLDGYVGGSTAERIPVEKGITAATQEFKALRLKG